MALQDLLRLQDVLQEDDDRPSAFGLTPTSSTPFNFYVPVASFMDENPIQFGQVSSRPGPGLPVASASWTPGLPVASSPSWTPGFPVASSSWTAGLPVASSSSWTAGLPVASDSVPLPFPMAHGTTTLAFVFQGGVLAAADTRSSCSGLVACPAAQKIAPIHSHLVGTTSGTSADCALWKRILSRELRLYQLRHGRRLSTSGAAKLLAHMLHPFKGTELCVAATLCGWDGPCDGSEASSTSCGASVIYVCSDGARLKGSLFSVGSGSPYAYSILDHGVRWGLTLAEATAVAREAVYRATHRDAYSGNCVDVYHVSSAGWKRRTREDLKEEYYREKERRREEEEQRSRKRQ